LQALLAADLATLSVYAPLRAVEPPRPCYEAPGRLPAGASGELFVSADEPVTYVVSYAGEVRQEVAQDHVFVLTAAPGVNDVVVTATDAAGNATTASLRVHGVGPAELHLTAPARRRGGGPAGLPA